jgi:hypothetical protein
VSDRKIEQSWGMGGTTVAARRVAVTFVLGICVLSGSKAWAQYRDYPRVEAPAQSFGDVEQGKWMIDGEVRGRTEDQTAINYLPGQNETYELTRVRGGIEVRPVNWFTGYMQFHDNHALALPLAYTASNMRDSFDLRQGFAELH